MRSVMMWALFWYIVLALVCLATAFSAEISIYDSPSDKTRSVIEFVDNRGRSHKLLVKTDELESRYEEIEQWTLKLDKLLK